MSCYRYRGPAHYTCNLNYQDSNTVPVVFHNMSAYDAHLILKDIAQAVEGRVNLLPTNKEKYISFIKDMPENAVKFRFIDSFRFMAGSLDKLSSYLENYPILKSEFKDLDSDCFELLTRKGVFPYDYMDSWEKLRDNQLPSKLHFYNKLEDRNINRKEYRHAENIWQKFDCRNLGDYSDLYLKTDILLLADVFEQFRESCCQTYGLDPAHAFTLPGYTWQCMMKHTQIELELLTDIDEVLFIERGIRGGLSQCSKRRATANNKYMPNYDPNKETNYLMYFDVNNQYGWAMCQYLPYGGFKWVEADRLTTFNVNEVPDDSDIGYILEVDVEVPENLHDYFSDLPPCPEHKCPPGSKNTKLMATLYDKERYVIHYRNLKQVIELGCNVRRVHRILQFKQSAWLKSYIDLNTRLRQAAKNEFEKNLYKLMNNAVFGKTMENIRKHSIVKLITKWDGRYGAEALIAKPEFKSATIFNEDLVAVELNKLNIFFNKPIYIGMSILDLAKTTIYSFHYDYMKKQLKDNCNVLYTDTDSLIYEIRGHDVYEIMRRDCHQYFDTSDYSADNVWSIPLVNKKVLGMMKDENNGQIVTDFVGLRAKMYGVKLLKTPEDKEKEREKLRRKGFDEDEIEEAIKNIGITKKSKGIKSSVVQTKITFDDYIKCLDNSEELNINQNLIKSEKHQVHSVTQTKIALSPHDDKRYIKNVSYETLPWGHYSIVDLG